MVFCQAKAQFDRGLSTTKLDKAINVSDLRSCSSYRSSLGRKGQMTTLSLGDQSDIGT